MEKTTKGITEIPNLGVHTSYKRARRHYDHVVAERKGRTRGHCIRSGQRGDERVKVLHEDDFYLLGETLRMERWRV